MDQSEYLNKIFRTIEKYKLVEKGDKIFVALSGGKDSAAVLFALKKFKEERNLDFEIIGFHIKLETIGSEKIQEIVEKQCELAGAKLVVFELKKEGINLGEIAKKNRRPVCSVCGVIKRYLMNKIPRELGATKIATGHHGDDILVFFIKNILGMNYSWIGKFRPKVESNNPKLLTKIRPLFFVGRRENEEFVKNLGVSYVQESLCIYFKEKLKLYEKTNKWYDIIDRLESEVPGFKERLLNSVIKMSTYFESEDQLKFCKICGEPTNTEICAFCRLTGKIKNSKL
jgi:tRNA(Ile)-lysidine synthase TilS/MesJ